MKKSIRTLLIVLGGLVVLLVAASILIKPDEIINANKGKITEAVSTSLGRELALGRIEGSLFPVLKAVVHEVKLAAAPGAAEPQITIGSVEVSIDMVAAVLSLGKDLRVKSLVLRDLTARLRRAEDGTWDFQDIQDHMATGEAEERPAPDTADEGSFLAGAKIDRLALEVARIEIDDAVLGRPLVVNIQLMETDQIRLGHDLNLRLRAALQDGQRQSAIAIDARLAQLGMDAAQPFPDLEVSARVQQLALGPWGGLLPPEALSAADGEVDLDLKLAATAGLSRLSASGHVDLKGLVLRQAQVRGKPLDLRCEINANLDTAKPSYDLDGLSLTGSGLSLSAALKAHALSPEGLEHGAIALKIEDLHRLLATIPADPSGIPPELRLEGPLTASFTGNATKLDLEIELTGARVGWGELFDKQPSRPLRLVLKGGRRGDRIEIPTFGLDIDTAHLGGNLSLGTKPGAPIQAKISSGSVEFASLRALLPPIEEALNRGDRVNGSFQLDAHAETVGGKQAAEVAISLTSLDLLVGSLSAKGAGKLTAGVRPTGDRTELSVASDLDKLALRSTDSTGDVVLDKPAGMPLVVDVMVHQTSARADVKRAQIKLGQSQLVASGSATGLDTPNPTLALTMDPVDLAFTDIRRTIPGAGDLPTTGRFIGRLEASGNPQQASTLGMRIGIERLTYGRAELKGTLAVRNLDRPQFEFDLQSPFLDIDELLGEGEPATETKGKPEVDENPHGLSRTVRASLASVSGKGKLRIGKAIFNGLSMDRFVGQLTMQNGAVSFEALDFDIYGGRISGRGTELDLTAEYTTYALKLDAKEVDLGRAIAEHSRVGRVFEGRTSQTIDVRGRGLTGPDLARTLDGSVNMLTQSLNLSSLDVLGAISAPLGGALQSAGWKKFKGLSIQGNKKAQGTTMRGFQALLQFIGGRFKLDKPVRTDTAFGALQLTGGGGLDNSLDFDATALLDPAIINRALGRNMVRDEVAVPFQIGGSWDRPQIKGVDLKGLLHSILGKGVEAITEQARDAVADQAEKMRSGAEAKARQAGERVEQEARLAAKKAEDKARETARDEAGKAKEAAEREAKKQADLAKNKARKKADEKAKEAAQKAKKMLGF